MKEGILLLGDWHVGKDTRKVERIAGQVAHQAVEEAKRMGMKALTVVGLGDFVEGKLRVDSVLVKESVPDQVVQAGRILRDVLGVGDSGLNGTTTVSFVMLSADNHARMFRKPIARKRGEWSLNRTIFWIATDRTKWTDSSTIVNGIVTRRKTYGGTTMMMTHGDIVASNRGMPYAGLERLMGRLVMGRGKVDLMVVGHFHRPALIGGAIPIVVNGALDEDRDVSEALGVVESPPCQVMLGLEDRKLRNVWLLCG